ncbi:MAG: hypothetical protein KGL39_43880 [Patescibacteria group bacterium]|nr:hypothetical protein [Patescibacteria group bacterium]
MRSVINWLKKNLITVGVCYIALTAIVVAGPNVLNGSLVVPATGTITDNNAANGTVPVVNASHVYAYATPNPTASNACLTVTTPVNALSPVIGIGNSNILAQGCGGNGTGVPSLSAGTGLASSGSWAAQTLGLAAAGSYTVLANNSGVSATPAPVTAAALAGMLSGSNGCPPQETAIFGTSTDTSGTYTTPICNGVTATVLWVRMAGGGGGGGGGGSGAGAAGAGDNSTFGSSFLTANGGSAGSQSIFTGGAGGTPSGFASQYSMTGTPGGSGVQNISGTFGAIGGCGGSNQLAPNSCSNALNASSGRGCGSGGAGGGANSAAASNTTGSGGGGGGSGEILITSPAASYSYVAGKFGAGGTAGTNGGAGGNGGGGCILVVATWGTL